MPAAWWARTTSRTTRCAPHHIKDDEVKGEDADETSFDFHDIPAGGGFAAQIRNIGVGGDTRYGGISGTTTSDADVSLFYQHVPLGATVDNLYVHTRNELAAGQSRTFSVVAYTDVEDGPSFEVLSCEIDGDLSLPQGTRVRTTRRRATTTAPT